MAGWEVSRTIRSVERTIVRWRTTSGRTQAHGQRAKRVLKRGVGAGRSAQRGTSPTRSTSRREKRSGSELFELTQGDSIVGLTGECALERVPCCLSVTQLK